VQPRDAAPGLEVDTVYRCCAAEVLRALQRGCGEIGDDALVE
jgi:hypothetical protein